MCVKVKKDEGKSRGKAGCVTSAGEGSESGITHTLDSAVVETSFMKHGFSLP